MYNRIIPRRRIKRKKRKGAIVLADFDGKREKLTENVEYYEHQQCKHRSFGAASEITFSTQALSRFGL